MSVVQTAEGEHLLGFFLDEQISRFAELRLAISASSQPRVARLHALYVAIIQDAISIRLLCEDGRTNQAYIISRALIERVTNFCFLQFCTDSDFTDYLDYSLNKVGRSLDSSIEVGGQVKARVALRGGDFELPPEIASAVAKFTSERGREKTRWTSLSLPDRAGVIEAKLSNTGLFMTLLMIYGDASEALHGTLYGATFHICSSPGLFPHDETTLERSRHEAVSALYLMNGGAMGTLLDVLKVVGEAAAEPFATASKKALKKAAIDAGLT
jgi:hypothetical protein